MSEYRPQLRIPSRDPACSADSIGDTVIGVLFDKKGSEIKSAISSRLPLIEKKIASYKVTAAKIELFIEKKRVILKDLDHFYEDKNDLKKALLRPFQREIEDIVKKSRDVIYDHDRKTYKELAEKALCFETGFEEYKDTFKELDDLLIREEKIFAAECEPVRGIGFSDPVQGSTGMCGIAGYEGVTGNKGIPDVPNLSLTEKNFPISEDEDRAVSRMKSLRNILKKYKGKLDKLQDTIESLEEESRRLTLIMKNISDDRSYKLDLNKLSAFGFEDLDQEECYKGHTKKTCPGSIRYKIKCDWGLSGETGVQDCPFK